MKMETVLQDFSIPRSILHPLLSFLAVVSGLWKTSFDANVEQDRRFYFLVIGLILCLLLSFLSWSFGKQTTPIPRDCILFQALLSVIAPTSCVWPPSYPALVRRTITSRSKVLSLPLSSLMRDVSLGAIEFRDCLNDLPDLLRNQLHVYGWHIRLDSGPFSWFVILRWILHSQMPALTVPSPQFAEPRAILEVTKKCKFDASKMTPLAVNSTDYSLLSLTPSLNQDKTLALCLDAVLYSQLNSRIRSLRSSLSAPVLIEISTLGVNVPFLSSAFIFAAVPFLPRRYIRSKHLNRTSTPLLTTLHHFTKLLSLANFSVDSIKNVSQEYATKLGMLSQELEEDGRMRLECIKELSLEGWREHRFLLNWEASLLTVGYLTRWSVVVR